jgi:hypothetical protein
MIGIAKMFYKLHMPINRQKFFNLLKKFRLCWHQSQKRFFENKNIKTSTEVGIGTKKNKFADCDSVAQRRINKPLLNYFRTLIYQAR